MSNLNDAVALFPTPTSTQHKGWSPGHNRAQTNDRLDYTIERQAHEQGEPKHLNPDWVEWLMGWPVGWTSLEPLESTHFEAWRESGAAWWTTDPAETGHVPRTTGKTPHRVQRLKAIGNGQVPLALVLAWTLLMDETE